MNALQRGPAETDATMQAQVIQDSPPGRRRHRVVSPSTSGAIESVLKQAKDAGIVVVTHEGASCRTRCTTSKPQHWNTARSSWTTSLSYRRRRLATTTVGHVTNAPQRMGCDGAVAHQKEKCS